AESEELKVLAGGPAAACPPTWTQDQARATSAMPALGLPDRNTRYGRRVHSRRIPIVLSLRRTIYRSPSRRYPRDALGLDRAAIHGPASRSRTAVRACRAS